MATTFRRGMAWLNDRLAYLRYAYVPNSEITITAFNRGLIVNQLIDSFYARSKVDPERVDDDPYRDGLEAMDKRIEKFLNTHLRVACLLQSDARFALDHDIVVAFRDDLTTSGVIKVQVRKRGSGRLVTRYTGRRLCTHDYFIQLKEQHQKGSQNKTKLAA